MYTPPGPEGSAGCGHCTAALCKTTGQLEDGTPMEWEDCKPTRTVGIPEQSSRDCEVAAVADAAADEAGTAVVMVLLPVSRPLAHQLLAAMMLRRQATQRNFAAPIKAAPAPKLTSHLRASIMLNLFLIANARRPPLLLQHPRTRQHHRPLPHPGRVSRPRLPLVCHDRLQQEEKRCTR